MQGIGCHWELWALQSGGMSPHEALQCATIFGAEAIGLQQDVGSLEVGKDATLFISEGDALDMLTCIVTQAFIQGREISLDNKHKQLARRFSEKY